MLFIYHSAPPMSVWVPFALLVGGLARALLSLDTRCMGCDLVPRMDIRSAVTLAKAMLLLKMNVWGNMCP